MNVYLATDFGRADDAAEIAQLVEQDPDVRVVSRWLTELRPEEKAAAAGIGGPPRGAALEAAERNLHDIDACDVFILMTTGSPARGGRHFEAGYAFARGKPIVIVGPVEHAFQHLARAVVPDAAQLPDALKDIQASLRNRG